MNTNRSYKLGTIKALRLLGSRRGLAPYQAMQQARAQQALLSMMIAPTERAANALRMFAKAAAAQPMVRDLVQLFELCKDGPFQNSLIANGDWDTGSPGVSVQDLTDLAQQYAYLHPTKEQAKRRYHEKYPRFFANK